MERNKTCCNWWDKRRFKMKLELPTKGWRRGSWSCMWMNWCRVHVQRLFIHVVCRCSCIVYDLWFCGCRGISFTSSFRGDQPDWRDCWRVLVNMLTVFRQLQTWTEISSMQNTMGSVKTEPSSSLPFVFDATTLLDHLLIKCRDKPSACKKEDTLTLLLQFWSQIL